MKGRSEQMRATNEFIHSLSLSSASGYMSHGLTIRVSDFIWSSCSVLPPEDHPQ
jgi:hypothetical protein